MGWFKKKTKKLQKITKCPTCGGLLTKQTGLEHEFTYKKSDGSCAGYHGDGMR